MIIYYKNKTYKNSIISKNTYKLIRIINTKILLIVSRFSLFVLNNNLYNLFFFILYDIKLIVNLTYFYFMALLE